jgi:predicted metal-dependent peptidase
MSKLSAEQRIERCHVQLMKHKNFALFSGLFMIGKVSVDDATDLLRVPTAWMCAMVVTLFRALTTSSWRFLSCMSPADDGEGIPTFDEHDWEGAGDATQEEKEQAGKEIEQALRQGSILVGKMGGNVDRNISEMLTPKIDWKEALREFVKSMTQGKDQSSWRRLHKRYLAADLIMPSSYSEKVGGITIAIDTSGSIGTEELSQFLSEVKSICEEVSPEVIDLLYWDTHVAARETYTENELSGLTESTKPAGGGGTEPACVPKYMNKHNIKPECLLMLSDGYIGAQKESDWNIEAPVLWCIKGNSRFVAPVGKTVHVE